MSAKKFLLLAGIALSVSACTDGDVGNGPSIGQSEDEIINGTLIPGSNVQPIANIRYVFGGLTDFVEGSGVFFSRELVVTAKHAVRGFPSKPNELFAHVRQGDLNQPERAIANIVTHQTLDLAYMFLDPAAAAQVTFPPKWKIDLAKQRPAANQPIAVFGYGAGALGGAFGTLRTMVAPFRSDVTSPTTITNPLNQIYSFPAGPDHYLLDIPDQGTPQERRVTNGDSGGPQFNMPTQWLQGLSLGLCTQQPGGPQRICALNLRRGSTGGNWIGRLLANTRRTSMNVDHKADLVFSEVANRRNSSVAYLNGTVVPTQPVPDGPDDGVGVDALPQQVAGNWELVGIGDFNGDGEGDSVFRDPSTGLVDIRLMDENRQLIASTGFIVSDTNWRIIALGDVDGDLVTDLLWHNTAGDIYAFMQLFPLVDDMLAQSQVNFPDAVSYTQFFTGNPGFDLVGAAELDTDERVFDASGAVVVPDNISDNLLWKHRTTGALEFWPMNLVQARCGDITDPNIRGNCGADNDATLVYERIKPAVSAGSRETFWNVGSLSDINTDGHIDIVWQAWTGAPPELAGNLEATLLNVDGPGVHQTLSITEESSGQQVFSDDELVGP